MLSVSEASVPSGLSPGSGVSTTAGGGGGGVVGCAWAAATPPPIEPAASAAVTAATILFFRFSIVILSGVPAHLAEVFNVPPGTCGVAEPGCELSQLRSATPQDALARWRQRPQTAEIWTKDRRWFALARRPRWRAIPGQNLACPSFDSSSTTGLPSRSGVGG